MASAKANWQTVITSIKERCKLMLNNELFSDVKFIVRLASGDGESKKEVIPAHKFVLAVSSPVFEAMFYGQMAEMKDTIDLPDCDRDGLLELFRYMYSDEVHLNGSNVMQVLYLANKYIVPSLASKCSAYLKSNLTASNVFSILPQAECFGEKDLVDRCWQVIETKSEEALKSNEFVTVERSLVESIVKKKTLNVKEVELFKAVDRWATNESEKRGLLPNGDLKRIILGEEIVKAIRFPLMSEREFAAVVLQCNILKVEEIVHMVKHFNNQLTSPLKFIQSERSASGVSNRLERCLRFRERCWPTNTPPTSDAICFYVNTDIFFHGVKLYYRLGNNVSVDVKSLNGKVSVVKTSMHLDCDNTSFDVLFDTPVRLREGIVYVVEAEFNKTSRFKRPAIEQYAGGRPKKYVTCSEVTFTFVGTVREMQSAVDSGQFPEFIFSTH